MAEEWAKQETSKQQATPASHVYGRRIMQIHEVHIWKTSALLQSTLSDQISSWLYAWASNIHIDT
jgi:hypothetical protein